jgi:hypothetical protein
MDSTGRPRWSSGDGRSSCWPLAVHSPVRDGALWQRKSDHGKPRGLVWCLTVSRDHRVEAMSCRTPAQHRTVDGSLRQVFRPLLGAWSSRVYSRTVAGRFYR